MPTAGTSFFLAAQAFNRADLFGIDEAVAPSPFTSAGEDLALDDTATFAVFSPAVSVPEPSTLLSFGLALLAMAGLGWRHRNR